MKIIEKEFLEFIDSFKNSIEFSRYKTLSINPEFYFDDMMKESLGVIKYVYDLESDKDFLYVNTNFFIPSSPLKNLLWEIRVIEQGRNKKIDCRSFNFFNGHNKRSYIRWGDGFNLTLTNITLKISHESQLRNLSLVGGNLVFDLNNGICNHYTIDYLFSDYNFSAFDTVYYMNEFVYVINGWEDIDSFKNFQFMISSNKYMIKKPLILFDLSLYNIRDFIKSGTIWKFLETIQSLNVNNLRIVGINYSEVYNKDFLNNLNIRNIVIPLYIYDIDDMFLYNDLSFDTFFDDLKSENLK